MVSNLPRCALIAVTSAEAPLHEGNLTGMFIGEALHPFNVFRKAGFEVDLASETGKYSVDWLSEQPAFLNGSAVSQWNDLHSEFREKLDHMPKAGELDSSKYGLFFASAGHAALIDYPHAKGLQKIATDVWNKGGIVSSVCHGPAIFGSVMDTTTGKSIINGKTITGFTTEGEYVMKLMDQLKAWGEPLVEELAKQLGAKYARPPGVWDSFHVTDGRLVTGTNPASATETAEAAVEAFDKL